MSRLPSLTAKKLIKAFRKAGFEIVREGGKHTVMGMRGHPYLVSVPRHKGDLARGLVRSLITAAGLTEAEFEALL